MCRTESINYLVWLFFFCFFQSVNEWQRQSLVCSLDYLLMHEQQQQWQRCIHAWGIDCTYTANSWTQLMICCPCREFFQFLFLSLFCCIHFSSSLLSVFFYVFTSQKNLKNKMFCLFDLFNLSFVILFSLSFFL